MPATKEHWQLSELEWRVLHAMQDLSREGKRPSGTSVCRLVSDRDVATVRRARQRVIAWGLFSLPPELCRRTTTERDPELTEEEIEDAKREEMADSMLRFLETPSEKFGRFAKMPISTQDTSDIIDAMIVCPEKLETPEAARMMVVIWDRTFPRRQRGSR